MLTAAREMLGGRPARRCWSRGNRSRIEVRGLSADTVPTLGTALVAAVRAEPGVRSVQLNTPLSRIVVSVDPGGPSTKALCALVTDVEDRVGTGPHQTTAARDGAGTAAGSWPSTTTGIADVRGPAPRPVVAEAPRGCGRGGGGDAADHQPVLRDAVLRRLGANATDTAFAVASAAVYTLTQAPASLAVEAARHLAQVAELTAAAQAWQRHEPALADHAENRSAAATPARPCPMPPGPVERHAQRSGTAQGIATPAVGLLTGSPNAAATAALVTAPKAARNAREAFAATLGRGLADRYDVLALRPRALRRLDRIDAVVVDPRVLLTDELKVSRLRTDSAQHHDQMWQWAQAQLLAGALGAGWHRIPPLGNGHGNGHSAAEVYVGHAHHPLAAAAVIGEIRRGDIEVVSVAGDELGDLRPSFDELLPADGTLDSALRDAVVTLQSEGRTVAVLSGTAGEALLAADLAIGVSTRRRHTALAGRRARRRSRRGLAHRARAAGRAARQPSWRRIGHQRNASRRAADDPGGARARPRPGDRRGGRRSAHRAVAGTRRAARSGAHRRARP